MKSLFRKPTSSSNSYIRPLTALALGLSGLLCRGDAPQPSISSIRFDGTNIVVNAQVPSGTLSATLEGRPSINSGLWVPRASEPLDGTGGIVTFHLAPSGQFEALRLRAEVGMDAYVAWVQPPAALVGGGPPGAYQVRVGRNSIGTDVMQVPVRVCVGNPVLACQDVLVDVARGSEITTTVFVPTPASYGTPCGNTTNLFPVTACVNLLSDANPNNNCQSAVVGIAVPYWDLRYDVAGPTSAHVGQTVSWTVTVRNVGNIPSQSLCSRTGIGLHTGDDYLDLVTGSLSLFTVPALLPGDSTSLQFSAVVPPGAASNQFIKAGVDTFSGCQDACPAGNQVDQPISICGADLAIANIELPSGLVGGVGPRTYYVTVRNDGCDPASGVWVRTCLGNDCEDVGPLSIAANGGATRVAVNLATPASYGANGQINYFPVTACLNGWVDATPANNCLTEQAPIAVPYWDLRVAIVSSPSRAIRNPCYELPQLVGWTIRVTNVGNYVSPGFNSSPCLLQTGILPQSGSANWNGTPLDGLRYWPIPSLAPGASTDFVVSGYRILCGAFLGTQYVKAGFFCDPNSLGNNTGERPIQILTP